ncbi:hypothetical protein ACGE24_05870 [Corynebacterium kroppenstedtii]|uniref:hypothetical protein n=1 Tax=Corynebacterium sp. PCR 32 TaxID=3351342 RepID=UPI00309E73AC
MRHQNHLRRYRTLSRRSRLMSAAIVCVAALPLASTAVANATPADSPQPEVPASPHPDAMCVPYFGDSHKGNGQFPLGLVAPDFGDDGYDALPVADNNGVPARVDFRDNHQGFNDKIDVALRHGSLLVRHRGTEQWRQMPTPDCLNGKIVSMSINGDSLIALDKSGWIYTLSNLLSSPTKWGWIRAWGGPVWLGQGWQSPSIDEGKWSFSLIDNNVDKTYSMPDGKEQPVSFAKVTQVVALGKDGSHLYSLDPWLARDYSYEIGTPFNSQFQVESVAASGSVIFITNKYGDMYTTLSDYDVRGADPTQFRYQWLDDNHPDPRPAATHALQHRLDDTTAPIGISGHEWTHQPKIPGTITNRISIHTTAPGSSHRELRVEGVNDKGESGLWHKNLTDTEWAFTVTNSPLEGKQLENSSTDRSQDTLVDDSPFSYEGKLTDNASLTINNFAYASERHPVTVTVNGRRYPLILDTVDGRLGTPLSQRVLPGEGEFGARPAGLVEGTPRDYMAAVRVPEETKDAARHDPDLKEFLDTYLKGDDPHQLYARVTPGEFQIINSPVKGIALPTPGAVATLRAVK